MEMVLSILMTSVEFILLQNTQKSFLERKLSSKFYRNSLKLLKFTTTYATTLRPTILLPEKSLKNTMQT